MFSITGKINGEKYILKYNNKILDGDELATSKAKEENLKNHGNLGMPPNVKANYLSCEDSAHMLITTYVFDEIISQEDDWPEIPENADI
ncbi:MAG: hypothetical protein FWD47_14765 [Treponema sp.]|nr:hypothetical protein [Treponema sp.]